ncbi:uncharacterized protein F5147DRAFT_654514 [Suillus discolor]|uniref:Uncharacterized protein n=1 Tax=Suillus discolor TaxID=1912936 RepID=A0A9P7F3N9_9AGAM|nr:uncharacterized protein F5147DRAFT_654514 [Suillus discolor]KAG2103995.1 hypothetical protein F5147DRAFT_654514 [Suillus discolor]
MSTPPFTAETVTAIADTGLTLTLADMANIFDFVASRLLAIRTTLETSTHVKSSKARHNVFILPWVALCEGILGMSQAELLNDQELYASFMKLPVQPSGPWVKGRLARTYELAWWHTDFDVLPFQDFITTFPPPNQLIRMIADHFTQLASSMLVTLATLVQPRSTLVAQQIAVIQAELSNEGEAIIRMIEDKVVEVRLLAASMLRMEAALSEDILEAIAATKHLVKYLKREAK